VGGDGSGRAVLGKKDDNGVSNVAQRIGYTQTKSSKRKEKQEVKHLRKKGTKESKFVKEPRLGKELAKKR